MCALQSEVCGGEGGDCVTVKLCLCVSQSEVCGGGGGGVLYCHRVRCVVGRGGGLYYCRAVCVCVHYRVRCVVGRGVTVLL